MPRPRPLVAALGLTVALAAPATAFADGATSPPHSAAAAITADSATILFLNPASGGVDGSSTDTAGSFLDADYSSVRDEVFYVRHLRGRDMVLRVDRAGRPSSNFSEVPGRLVTVSPDGRFLAWVSDPDGTGPGTESITVRNLDTGQERRFAGPPPGFHRPEVDGPVINDLAISPDATRLVFDYFLGGRVFVLDLVTGRSLADATTPLDRIPGAHSPAWLDHATVAVIDIDGQVRTAAVSGGGAVDGFDLPGYAVALDADDSGRLLVKLLGAVQDSAEPTFAMVDHDGTFTFITKPYASMVW
jgi:hypothetical protein